MNPTDPPSVEVVFVDDDPYVLGSMKRVFEDPEIGWHSEFFANPGEALKHVQHQPCDVVVSDATMPGMSGLELLAGVRACQPSAFCILLSGELPEADRLECEARGYMFIEKPFSLLYLRSIIAGELERFRQERRG